MALLFLPVEHATLLPMKTETMIDPANRLIITSAMRRASGIKPGQILEVKASPGVLIISSPHVPAKLVKKGKLKVIDAPLPDIDVAEAVNRARHYTR